jgi:RNAse (barnase) inhibitor barstar
VRFASGVTDDEIGVLTKALEEAGIIVRDTGTTVITTERQLVDDVAALFQWPDEFGHNWDALLDVLRDLSWMPAKGYVLLFRHADKGWAQNPAVLGVFVEIWLSAAEFWAKYQISFHLIFLLDQTSGDLVTG